MVQGKRADFSGNSVGQHESAFLSAGNVFNFECEVELSSKKWNVQKISEGCAPIENNNYNLFADLCILGHRSEYRWEAGVVTFGHCG